MLGKAEGESEGVGEKEKREMKGRRRRKLTDSKLSLLFLRERAWFDIIRE